MSMSEPAEGRFEVLEEQGPPRGDLYELEQKTTYRVVNRHSGQTVMTFESLMEASLSTDTGMWDDYRFSGVRQVSIAPYGQSIIVRYHDGREETLPLPQTAQQEEGPMTLDEFFAGYEESRRIFDILRAAVEALGPVEIRATKSQVAFRRGKAFAWAWVPDRYLGGGHAPLVLTLSFRQRDSSPRWKQIVEPAPGRFTHHLELRSAPEIDAEVRSWLQSAWEASDGDER